MTRSSSLLWTACAAVFLSVGIASAFAPHDLTGPLGGVDHASLGALVPVPGSPLTAA